MRRSLTFACVALFLALMPVSSAVASPKTFQRFEAHVLGSAGTNAKPKPVELDTRPYFDFGVAGGPTNSGGLNSGSTLEVPFATVFSTIYLDKALTTATGVFPGCNIHVALDTPDKCPAGSRVDTPSSASGLARSTNDSGGKYVLKTNLEVKIFVLSTDSRDRPAHDMLGLRVVTPLATAIVEGQLSPATGADKKLYGQKMRFTIPTGLIVPTDGLVSQLLDFDTGIKRAVYKGTPLIGLRSCPASKKLSIGYRGEYSIKPHLAEQTHWRVDEVSNRIDVKVPCH